MYQGVILIYIVHIMNVLSYLGMLLQNLRNHVCNRFNSFYGLKISIAEPAC